MAKKDPKYSQEQWARAMNLIESGAYADQPEKEKILFQRAQEYADLSGMQHKRDSSTVPVQNPEQFRPPGTGEPQGSFNPQVWYEPSIDRVKQYYRDNPKMLERFGAEQYDVDEKTGEVVIGNPDSSLLYKRAAEAMYADAYDQAKASGMTLHRYKDMEPGVGKVASWLMGKAAGAISGGFQGFPLVGTPVMSALNRGSEALGTSLPGTAEAMIDAPEEQLGAVGGFATRVAGGVGAAGSILPRLGSNLIGGAAQVGMRAGPASSILGRAAMAGGVGGAIGGVTEAGQVAGEAIAGKDISAGEAGARVGLGAGAGAAFGLGGELIGTYINKLPAYLAENEDFGPGLDALRKSGGDTNFGLKGLDIGQEMQEKVNQASRARADSYTSPGLRETLVRSTAPKVYARAEQTIGALRDADTAFKLSKEGQEQFHSVAPALDRAVDVVTRREGVPFADAGKVAKELPKLVETRSFPAKEADAMLAKGWRILPDDDWAMPMKPGAQVADDIEVSPILDSRGMPLKGDPPPENVTLFRPKQLNAQQLDEAVDALDTLARAGSKDGASDPAYRELSAAVRETRDQFKLDGKEGGWSRLKGQMHEKLDDFSGIHQKDGGPWEKLSDDQQKLVEQALMRKVGRERFNEAMSVFQDEGLMKELQQLRASEFVREMSKRGEIRGPLNRYDWIKMRADALARGLASTAGTDVQKLPNLSNKLLRKVGALRGGSAARIPSSAAGDQDVQTLLDLIGMSELYDSLTGKEKEEP